MILYVALAIVLAAANAEKYHLDHFCVPVPLRYGHYEPRVGFVKIYGQVTYHCGEGYKLVGQKTATCLESGWDAKFPACVFIKKCRRPKHPINGYLTPGYKVVFNQLDTIKYECNQHYALQGHAVHTCLETGKWSYPQPRCIALKCDPPRGLRYVTYTPQKSVYYVDEKVYVGCSGHYQLTGSKVLTCLKGGYWSGRPSCTAYCPPPRHHAQGGYKPVHTTYAPGATISYVCHDGLAVHGYKTNKCLGDGTWQYPAPSCGAPRCHAPRRPQHGVFDPYKQYYEAYETIYFTCGYPKRLYGEAHLKCLPNGYWNYPIPYCGDPYCEALDAPKHGYLKPIQKKYKVDQGLWFFCQEPFKIYGAKDIHCLPGGHWSHKPPICKIAQCPPPPFIHYGTYQPIQHEYPVGSFITAYCHYGYAIKGQQRIRCNEGGSWSHSFPVCQRGCKRPNNPQFGYVTPYKSVFAVGEQIWYKCIGGYRAVPEADIVCLPNHRWSREVRCVTEGSCKGRCGQFNAGSSCQCDAKCYERRNCCTDYNHICFETYHH